MDIKLDNMWTVLAMRNNVIFEICMYYRQNDDSYGDGWFRSGHDSLDKVVNDDVVALLDTVSAADDLAAKGHGMWF